MKSCWARYHLDHRSRGQIPKEMKRNLEQTTSDERMFTRLLESPLYATYRQAFMNATGLNLELVPTDEHAGVAQRRYTPQRSFCQLVNQTNRSGACPGCDLACRQLWKSAEDKSTTVTCFAGMRETAIPVRAGQTTIALLTTGQVFTSRPGKSSFEAVKDELTQYDVRPEQIEKLRQAWTKTRVVPIEQYDGTITLLAAFALQLSDLFNRLLLEETHQEPGVIIRAKQFINANLEDKINLEDVAHHAGVSTFYFCKIFKRTTKLTLTEYVNRRRVERAKHRLLNPQARVTEVAYEVGYQSLSQFNRSFLKYVGISPTKFRERHRQKTEIRELHAA